MSFMLPLSRREFLVAAIAGLGLANGRDGVFYVPPAAENTRAPLLLYLHGANGSGRRTIERLLPHADRTGTIIVAPDSRDETWGIAMNSPAADQKFIDAALDKVARRASIDSSRLGIAGFSDGASAALSIGLGDGDRFRSIGAFSPGFVHTTSGVHGRPRVFISHGTADDILPIERCGRRIARALSNAGLAVTYREFDGPHTVPESIRRDFFDWFAAAG